jgi:hypothetical protein
MNEGLKVIAERLKTHPEEFTNEDGKWRHLLNRMSDPAFPWEEHEKDLISKVLVGIELEKKKAIRERFTRAVMTTLMVDDEREFELPPNPYEPPTQRRSYNSSQIEEIKYRDSDKFKKMQEALQKYVEGEQ